MDLIISRGFAHEAAYLAELRERYGNGEVVEIPDPDRKDIESITEAADATKVAMAAGPAVIYVRSADVAATIS